MKTRVAPHEGQVHDGRLRGGQGGTGGPRPPGSRTSGAPRTSRGRYATSSTQPSAATRPVRKRRHRRLHGHHHPRLPDAADHREVGVRGRDHPQREEPGAALKARGIPRSEWALDQGAARPQHPQRGGRAHGLPTGEVLAYAGSASLHREEDPEAPAAVRRPRGRLASARVGDQAAGLPHRASTTRR